LAGPLKVWVLPKKHEASGARGHARYQINNSDEHIYAPIVVQVRDRLVADRVPGGRPAHLPDGIRNIRSLPLAASVTLEDNHLGVAHTESNWPTSFQKTQR
jgi:hypothetical protein